MFSSVVFADDICNFDQLPQLTNDMGDTGLGIPDEQGWRLVEDIHADDVFTIGIDCGVDDIWISVYPYYDFLNLSENNNIKLKLGKRFNDKSRTSSNYKERTLCCNEEGVYDYIDAKTEFLIKKVVDKKCSNNCEASLITLYTTDPSDTRIQNSKTYPCGNQNLTVNKGYVRGVSCTNNVWSFYDNSLVGKNKWFSKDFDFELNIGNTIPIVILDSRAFSFNQVLTPKCKEGEKCPDGIKVYQTKTGYFEVKGTKIEVSDKNWLRVAISGDTFAVYGPTLPKATDIPTTTESKNCQTFAGDESLTIKDKDCGGSGFAVITSGEATEIGNVYLTGRNDKLCTNLEGQCQYNKNKVDEKNPYPSTGIPVDYDIVYDKECWIDGDKTKHGKVIRDLCLSDKRTSYACCVPDKNLDKAKPTGEGLPAPTTTKCSAFKSEEECEANHICKWEVLSRGEIVNCKEIPCGELSLSYCEENTNCQISPDKKKCLYKTSPGSNTPAEPTTPSAKLDCSKMTSEERIAFIEKILTGIKAGTIKFYSKEKLSAVGEADSVLRFERDSRVRLNNQINEINSKKEGSQVPGLDYITKKNSEYELKWGDIRYDCFCQYYANNERCDVWKSFHDKTTLPSSGLWSYTKHFLSIGEDETNIPVKTVSTPTEDNVKEAEKYFNEGKTYYDKKDYTNSETSFIKAINKNPLPLYYNYLGASLYKHGMNYDLQKNYNSATNYYKWAIENYDKAITLGEKTSDKDLGTYYGNRCFAYTLLGNAYHSLEYYDSAIADCNKSCNLGISWACTKLNEIKNLKNKK